ncbi:MAG: hypothetical protein H7Y03_05495 [Chitinophagaceae bacterium]|nr:hypothetical protein [Chitinophagaceae bacterium]
MKHILAFSFCVALAGFSLSSCSKDEDEVQVPLKEIVLRTSATLGTYLTDKDGRALYYFSNDATGQNSCAGGCAAVWPVFEMDTLRADQLGDGLDRADFTTVITASGKKQVAYKSWPLYYYSPAVGGVNTPEITGATTGDGVNGVWFVAKPDYTIMLVNAQLVGANGKNYLSDYTEGTGRTLYFTDAKGVTLYAFKPDKNLTNTFTKPDFSNNGVWPLYETDKAVVPSALDKSFFVGIDVFGRKQLTYKGWPLYYFGADAGVRGVNKGVSVPSPGVWPVVYRDISTAPL